MPEAPFRHHPGRCAAGMSKVLLQLTVIRRGPTDGWSSTRRTAQDPVVPERGSRAGNYRAVEVKRRIGERHRSIALQTGGISGDKRILQTDLGTQVSLDS